MASFFNDNTVMGKGVLLSCASIIPIYRFQTLEKNVQFQTIGNRYAKVQNLKHRKEPFRKSGQVMLEYVIALGVFLALVGISATLIYVFRMYGNRVLDIIAVS